MRQLGFLALLAGCTGAAAPVVAPPVTFEATPSTWKLTPTDEGKTHMVLELGEASMDFCAVEGACAPNPELPFTEVQGQKSFAALKCSSPDGGTRPVTGIRDSTRQSGPLRSRLSAPSLISQSA